MLCVCVCVCVYTHTLNTCRQREHKTCCVCVCVCVCIRTLSIHADNVSIDMLTRVMVDLLLDSSRIADDLLSWFFFFFPFFSPLDFCSYSSGLSSLTLPPVASPTTFSLAIFIFYFYFLFF